MVASGRDTEIVRAGRIGAVQFADTQEVATAAALEAGSAATSAVVSTAVAAFMAVEVSTVLRTAKSLLRT